MPVTGQGIVIDNIIAYGGGALRNVDKSLTKVSGILDRAVTKNISLPALSKAQLKQLDHPYAKRHGPEGRKITDPFYQVHTVSGKLKSSKSSGVVKASVNSGRLTGSAFVKLDEGQAEHASSVVYGTSKMIPRPVLEGSRSEVLGKAVEIVRNALKDLTVNFRGANVS